MLRRSILNFSSRRSVGRIPQQIASQKVPPFTLTRGTFQLSPRKMYPQELGLLAIHLNEGVILQRVFFHVV